MPCSMPPLSPLYAAHTRDAARAVLELAHTRGGALPLGPCWRPDPMVLYALEQPHPRRSAPAGGWEALICLLYGTGVLILIEDELRAGMTLAQFDARFAREQALSVSLLETLTCYLLPHQVIAGLSILLGLRPQPVLHIAALCHHRSLAHRLASAPLTSQLDSQLTLWRVLRAFFARQLTLMSDTPSLRIEGWVALMEEQLIEAREELARCELPLLLPGSELPLRGAIAAFIREEFVARWLLPAGVVRVRPEFDLFAFEPGLREFVGEVRLLPLPSR